MLSGNGSGYALAFELVVDTHRATGVRRCNNTVTGIQHMQKQIGRLGPAHFAHKQVGGVHSHELFYVLTQRLQLAPLALSHPVLMHTPDNIYERTLEGSNDNIGSSAVQLLQQHLYLPHFSASCSLSPLIRAR